MAKHVCSMQQMHAELCFNMCVCLYLACALSQINIIPFVDASKRQTAGHDLEREVSIRRTYNKNIDNNILVTWMLIDIALLFVLRKVSSQCFAYDEYNDYHTLERNVNATHLLVRSQHTRSSRKCACNTTVNDNGVLRLEIRLAVTFLDNHGRVEKRI